MRGVYNCWSGVVAGGRGLATKAAISQLLGLLKRVLVNEGGVCSVPGPKRVPP